MLNAVTAAKNYTEESIQRLKNQVEGLVLVPSSAQYDDVRAAWNLTVDQHPAVIVVVYNVDDVVEAVLFAREEGLKIAVQATGHGVARPADGALMIVMSNLTHVDIDAEAQTAWVQGGAMWKMVLEKSQEFGLAPLLGSSPGVGVVGYTLGGGMGWLARKYGLAADSVIEFEVVTMDGQVLRVSKTENRDLFWGLRGAGGSLAIVTGVKMKLYPVAMVYGGNLIYPAALAPQAFRFFREWVKTLPNDMTASIALMNLPPIPEVPEFLRGQSVVFVRGCYSGENLSMGAELIQPWLHWQAPIANLFGEMPFKMVGMISNDPEHPVPALGSGVWLNELSDSAIDTIVEHTLPQNGSPMMFSEIRFAGGAMSEARESAYTHRTHEFLLQMVGAAPTSEVYQMVEHFIADYKASLGSAAANKVYMNFLEHREKWEKTAHGYLPDAYQRLTELKSKYDPDNLLNHSFNIPPAKR